MTGIPPRTTAVDWYTLLRTTAGSPEPIAATTHELDATWRNLTVREPVGDEDILAWIMNPRYKQTPPRDPSQPMTILGRRVVEIPDWPDWMEPTPYYGGSDTMEVDPERRRRPLTCPHPDQ